LPARTQAFSFHLKVKTLIRMETFWKQIRKKVEEEEEIRERIFKICL
jgi:predicted 3-demethylubiquinone-9 3-methyltransferase (glyoxalase superfamily)